MEEKIINGFAWLQSHHACLKKSLKKKDGQGIMEYGIVFVIVGLGILVSLTKFQVIASDKAVRQAKSLSEIGKSFF